METLWSLKTPADLTVSEAAAANVQHEFVEQHDSREHMERFE
jgi:hypothetical protein